MGWNLIEGIIPESSWVLLPRFYGHEFYPHFELALFPFEIFRQDWTLSMFLLNFFWVSPRFFSSFVFVELAHATIDALYVDGYTI